MPWNILLVVLPCVRQMKTFSVISFHCLWSSPSKIFYCSLGAVYYSIFKVDEDSLIWKNDKLGVDYWYKQMHDLYCCGWWQFSVGKNVNVYKYCWNPQNAIKSSVLGLTTDLPPLELELLEPISIWWWKFRNWFCKVFDIHLSSCIALTFLVSEQHFLSTYVHWIKLKKSKSNSVHTQLFPIYSVK